MNDLKYRIAEEEIENVLTALKKAKANASSDGKPELKQSNKQRERGGRIKHLLDTIDLQQAKMKQLTNELTESAKELNDLALQEKEKEKTRNRESKKNLLQRKMKDMEKKRRAHEKNIRYY